METNIKQNITVDEPQKPVVPQFVADWYEKIKSDPEITLFSIPLYLH